MAKQTTTAESKQPVEDAPKGELVTQEAPAGSSTALTVVDFGDDAGKGMENVSADEFRIPFLRVLDAKSPQVRPQNMGGIPGAKAGDIYNTATGEVWDGAKGFVWIPCYRDHNFIEWIPKNDDGTGGGFVGVHKPEEQIVGQLRSQHGRFGKLPMENGNQLAETFYLYGLAMPTLDDPPIRAMIAFASTQIPKYQNFVGRYQNIKYQTPNNGPLVLPPLWAHRWRLTTGMEVKGTMSWYGWKISLDARDDNGVELRPVASLLKRTDMLYVQGKEFYELIQAGKVAVNYSNATGTEPDKGDTNSAQQGSDDIPM